MKKKPVHVSKRGGRGVRFLLPAVILLFLLSSVLLTFFLLRNEAGSLAATVDGEPVTEKELQLFMNENRAGVYDYFKKKFNVEDHENFWTTSVEGEIPLAAVKERAMKEITSARVLQILAREKGLQVETDYAAFLKNLEKENKRRKKAVESNEIIFGPVQYSEMEYYRYLLDQLRAELKEKMAGQELLVSNREAEEYYISMRDKLFRKTDSSKVMVIKNTLEVMQEVKDRLDNGESFEGLARLYSKDGQPQTQTLDESTLKTDEIKNPELLEESWKLSPGEVSGIFEAGRSQYAVIKCLEKKVAGYATFEEVRETVVLQLREKKFEELLSGLAESAEIEINQPVFDRMKVR